MTPFPTRIRFAVLALLALAAGARPAHAQSSTPFWQQPSQPPPATAPAPVPRRIPPNTAPTTPQGQQPPGQGQAAAPAKPSPTIARIEGRPISQADFDRIAQPYFARLKAQLGTGYEGDIVKIANHNVLDELLRRELLGIAAKREGITPSPADVDTVLARDPFFWQKGTFDRAQFDLYKTSPTSNYQQMLPSLRELAAMDMYDRKLRARLEPSAADVKAEWSKRNDKLKYQYVALLQRDVSLEAEAPPSAWEAYYRAHSDQFMRKTRIKLRYVRLPLPGRADSTRAAEEAKAQERAKGIADSLAKHTLPDTSAELIDSGWFEPAGGIVPGLGQISELQSVLGQADSVASVKKVGPVVTDDAVIVGVVADRDPAHVPPYAEVMSDAKRFADADARREAGDKDRLAFYNAHPDRWRTSRATVSRLVLSEQSVTVKPMSKSEIDRGYPQNGRSWLGMPDSSRTPLQPLDDSLRNVIKTRVEAERRTALVQESAAKLAPALSSSRDVRAAAKSTGAVAETLTLVRSGPPDTLFRGAMLDTLFQPAGRGVVRGPRRFGARWVAWRVESADTAFVPPYDVVRGSVDRDVRAEQQTKDEVEGKTYFDAHRTKYKTPLRYTVEYVAVKIASPDSVRIPEADIRKEYDTHKDRYRQEEQVRAHHLLISTREPGVSDAKARARADSLHKALKDGADFVTLARQFSQEPGASQSGGDLGWFGRGRMVKEFETAAFALKPGQISDVVKTQFGYHIIHLDDHRPAGVRSFEDVQPEIRSSMAAARADSNARRAAASLRKKLVNGGVPAALAAPYGGVQSPAPFGATEAVPSLGFVQGLAADLPNVTTGKWAPAVYRSGTQYVVVRVKQRVAPHQAEFDEVKQQAVDDMKTEKKQKKFDEKMLAMRSSLKSGTKLDVAAAPLGGLKDSDWQLTNAAFLPALGYCPHVMPKLRAMKIGEQSDTLTSVAGVMWARLQDKKPADPAGFSAQREQLKRELEATRMNDWLEAQKKTVKIEVLRADLREPKPGPYKTVTIGG
jgi:parvulin-like peptidyl-prolyl isomerase